MYNERLAFWLYMEDGPEIRRRWIERVVLSQNPDGGWTWDRGVIRALKEMVGIYDYCEESAPHPTFLAVYALAEYRELLRAESERGSPTT